GTTSSSAAWASAQPRRGRRATIRPGSRWARFSNQEPKLMEGNMNPIVSRLPSVLGWAWIALFAFSSLVQSTLRQQVAALQTQVAALQTAVTTLTAQSATQSTQIAALQAGAVPVGTIIAYSAETPPAGYFECDGTELSRTSYPGLFAAIGT